MTQLTIDMVSDVACPWCPIGYKRLEQARELLAPEGITFTLQWRPFQLAPDMPDEGPEIVPHLMRKYGRSEAEVIQSQQQIMAAAKALGLNFEGALRRHAVNTFDAHRLLTWAGEQGCQTEFSLGLFDAYFGRAENPSDPVVLRRVAASLDLDTATVDKILASDRYADDVRQHEHEAHRAGIHAVPSFMVNGRLVAQGAQPAEALANTLRQVAAPAAWT